MIQNLTERDLVLHALFSLMFIGFSIIVIFYFPRLLGLGASFVVSLYSWRRYRVEIGFKSLSFSIIGGHILFKNFYFVSENMTIKIVHGRISLRYWLDKVRQCLPLAPYEFLYPRSLTSSSVNRASEPCRIALECEGLQIFVYNYTPTYDWILETYFSKKDPVAPDNASVIVEDFDGLVKEKVDKAPVSKSSNVASKLESKLVGKDKSNNNLPFLLKLLPVELKFNRGSVVVGHDKAPSLFVICFNAASGSVNAFKSRSELDLYKNLLEMDLEGVKCLLRENPFVSVDGGQSLHLKEDERLPQGLWGMLCNWLRPSYKKLTRRSRVSELFWTHDQVHLSDPSSPSATFNCGPNWKGLSRYQDAITLIFEFVKQHEYAKADTVLDARHLHLVYYFDQPGEVPMSSKKNRFRSNRYVSFATTNGATESDDDDEEGREREYAQLPPEWGYNLTFRQCVANFGPWSLKHLKPIIAFYSPWVYKDLVRTPSPEPGSLRSYDECSVNVRFEDETTFKIPFREHSKNHEFVTRFGQEKSTASNNEMEQSMNIPEYILQRSSAYLDLKLGSGTTISCFVPMLVDKARGYTVQLDCFSEEIRLVTSLNYTDLLKANQFKLSLSMDTPIVWHQARRWSYEVYMTQARLFLLYDHINLLSDLSYDWNLAQVWAEEMLYKIAVSKKAGSDELTQTILKSTIVTNEDEAGSQTFSDTFHDAANPRRVSEASYLDKPKVDWSGLFDSYEDFAKYHFIPTDMRYKIHILDCKLYLNVNQYNIINHPNDLSDNTFIIFDTPRFESSFGFSYDVPQPIHAVVPFDLKMWNLKVYISFPESNTNSFLEELEATEPEEYININSFEDDFYTTEKKDEKGKEKVQGRENESESESRSGTEQGHDEPLRSSSYSLDKKGMKSIMKIQLFQVNGNFDYMTKIDPKTATDTLDISIKCRSSELLLFGFVLKYWDIFLDNYFGVDSSFLTFTEYKDKILAMRRLATQTLKHEPIAVASKSASFSMTQPLPSNPLLCQIMLSMVDSTVLLPVHLYSMNEPMILFLDQFQFVFINSVAYQDLNATLDGVYLAPNPSPACQFLSKSSRMDLQRKKRHLPTELNDKEHSIGSLDYIYLGRVTVHGYKLYSLESSLVYQHKWQVKLPSLVNEAMLSPLSLHRMSQTVRVLEYGLKDVDNEVPSPRATAVAETNAPLLFFNFKVEAFSLFFPLHFGDSDKVESLLASFSSVLELGLTFPLCLHYNNLVTMEGTSRLFTPPQFGSGLESIKVSLYSPVLASSSSTVLDWKRLASWTASGVDSKASTTPSPSFEYLWKSTTDPLPDLILKQSVYLKKEDEANGAMSRILRTGKGEIEYFYGFPDSIFPDLESDPFFSDPMPMPEHEVFHFGAMMSTSDLESGSEPRSSRSLPTGLEAFQAYYVPKARLTVSTGALKCLPTASLFQIKLNSAFLKRIGSRLEQPVLVGFQFHESNAVSSASYRGNAFEKKSPSAFYATAEATEEADSLLLHFSREVHLLLCPYVVPWLVYFQSRVLESVASIISVEDVLDHLHLSYLKVLMAKYATVSTTARPDVHFQLRVPCVTVTGYYGLDVSSEDESLVRSLFPKGDAFLHPESLVVSNALYMQTFFSMDGISLSLLLRHESFMSIRWDRWTHEVSNATRVSDDEDSLSSSEETVSGSQETLFGVKIDVKHPLYRAVQAAPLIVKTWLPQQLVQQLKWKFEFHRLSGRVELMDAPIVSPKKLSSEKKSPYFVPENDSSHRANLADLRMYADLFSFSGQLLVPPELTSSLLYYLRHCAAPLMPSAVRPIVATPLAPTLSKGQWRKILAADQNASLIGHVSIELDELSHTLSSSRPELVRLILLLASKVQGQVEKAVQEIQLRELSYSRKWRRAVQVMTFQLATSHSTLLFKTRDTKQEGATVASSSTLSNARSASSPSTGASKDVSVAPLTLSSVPVTTRTPYSAGVSPTLSSTMGHEPSIIDPVFISRPSDMWRIGNRPHQQDQGWKVLYRLCSLYQQSRCQRANLDAVVYGLRPRREFHENSNDCDDEADDDHENDSGAYLAEWDLYARTVSALGKWRHWEIGDLSECGLLKAIYPRLYLPKMLLKVRHALQHEPGLGGLEKDRRISTSTATAGMDKSGEGKSSTALSQQDQYLQESNTRDKWQGIGYYEADSNMGLKRPLQLIVSFMNRKTSLIFIEDGKVEYSTGSTLEPIVFTLGHIYYSTLLQSRAVAPAGVPGKRNELMSQPSISSNASPRPYGYDVPLLPSKTTHSSPVAMKHGKLSERGAPSFVSPSSVEHSVALSSPMPTDYSLDSQCQVYGLKSNLLVEEVEVSLNALTLAALYVPISLALQHLSSSSPTSSSILSQVQNHQWMLSLLKMKLQLSLQSLELSLIFENFFSSVFMRDQMPMDLISNVERFQATLTEDLGVRRSLVGFHFMPISETDRVISNAFSLYRQDPFCKVDMAYFELYCHQSLPALEALFGEWKRSLPKLPYFSDLLSVLKVSLSSPSPSSQTSYEMILKLFGSVTMSLAHAQIALSRLLDDVSPTLSPAHLDRDVSTEEVKSEILFIFVDILLSLTSDSDKISYYTLAKECGFIYTPSEVSMVEEKAHVPSSKEFTLCLPSFISVGDFAWSESPHLSGYFIFESFKLPPMNVALLDSWIFHISQLSNVIMDLRQIFSSAMYTESSLLVVDSPESEVAHAALDWVSRLLLKFSFDLRLLINDVHVELCGEDDLVLLWNVNSLHGLCRQSSFNVNKESSLQLVDDIIQYISDHLDLSFSSMESRLAILKKDSANDTNIQYGLILFDVLIHRSLAAAASRTVQLLLPKMKAELHPAIPVKLWSFVKYYIDELQERWRRHVSYFEKLQRQFHLDLGTPFKSSLHLGLAPERQSTEPLWKILFSSGLQIDMDSLDIVFVIDDEDELIVKRKDRSPNPTNDLILTLHISHIGWQLLDFNLHAPTQVQVSELSVAFMERLKSAMGAIVYNQIKFPSTCLSLQQKSNGMYALDISSDSYQVSMNPLLLEQLDRLYSCLKSRQTAWRHLEEELLSFSASNTGGSDLEPIHPAIAASPAEVGLIWSLRQLIQAQVKLAYGTVRIEALDESLMQSYSPLTSWHLSAKDIEKNGIEPIVLFMPTVLVHLNWMIEASSSDPERVRHRALSDIQLGLEQPKGEQEEDMLHTSVPIFTVPLSFVTAMIQSIDIHALLDQSEKRQGPGQSQSSPTRSSPSAPSSFTVGCRVRVLPNVLKYVMTCGSGSKVLATIEFQGLDASASMESSELGVVWSAHSHLSSVLLKIKHSYAPEDCFVFSASDTFVQCSHRERLSLLNTKVSSLNVELKLRYLQDLLVFYSLWVQPYRNSSSCSEKETVPSMSRMLHHLVISQIDVHVDMSQTLGNMNLLITEAQFREFLSDSSVTRSLSLQTLWLSSLGRLNGVVDLRQFDLLWTVVALSQSPSHHFLVSKLDVKLEHQYEPILVSRAERLLLSAQFKDGRLEWSAEMDWQLLIVLVSKETGPVVSLLYAKWLAFVIEKAQLVVSSGGHAIVTSPRESRDLSVRSMSVSPLSLLEGPSCPLLRLITRGENLLLLFYQNSFYDSHALELSVSGLLFSFTRHDCRPLDLVEIEDLDTILNYYHSQVTDQKSPESQQILRLLTSLEDDGIRWSECLLQVEKLNLSRLGLVTTVQKKTPTPTPTPTTAAAAATTELSPNSTLMPVSTSASLWIETVSRSENISERRRVVGLDAPSSLYMETLQPLQSLSGRPDCLFFKLLTDFDGPIDVSLHLGMYKFTGDVIKSYQHSSLFPEPTTAAKSGLPYTKNDKFIPLIPVQIEPQIKIMAEATPKLEKILEWMGLGGSEESSAGSSGSGAEEQASVVLDAEISGDLATGRVRSDRKELIAKVIRNNGLAKLDAFVYSLWHSLSQ